MSRKPSTDCATHCYHERMIELDNLRPILLLNAIERLRLCQFYTSNTCIVHTHLFLTRVKRTCASLCVSVRSLLTMLLKARKKGIRGILTCLWCPRKCSTKFHVTKVITCGND